MRGRGQRELKPATGGAHGHLHAGEPHLGTLEENVGALVALRAGDDALAGCLRRSKHAVRLVDVQAHHAAPGLGEHLELAGKVILEVGVLDGRDVVLADVGEAHHGEVHAIRAVVLEGLARCLHHQLARPHTHGVGDVRLELEGLGSGELGGPASHAVVERDAGEDGCGVGAQRLGAGVEHALEVVGAGGLSLGAREGADGDVARRVAVEHVGQDAHRAAHVAHLHAGGVDALEGRLGQVGHGSRGKRGHKVGALEGAALAYEERAGHHLARVGGDEVDDGLRLALRQVTGEEDLRGAQGLHVRAQGDGGPMGCLHRLCDSQNKAPRERFQRGAACQRRCSGGYSTPVCPCER